ncbi:MAG: four helix bundle protein, partial [bacterium]|nr:four helix bundle protein [bacterium]
VRKGKTTLFPFRGAKSPGLDFLRLYHGLTSQIQRAAVSAPANIAEGFKKRTAAEKIRYLNISQSSLEECRYFLILIEDLDYAETKAALERIEVVSKILESYIKGIKRNHG